MKIAILNHSYFTREHIKRLEKLGEVIEYPNTDNLKDAIERAYDADIVIADSFEFSINKDFFESTNKLRLLCLNSTGFNLVDIVAAKNKGISVSNLPGFSTESVAEHAIALMFNVLRNINIGNTAMHQKPFQLNPANRAHDVYISRNINERKLGIIGFGQIGSRIAELGKGLGMNVIAYNRTPKQVEGVKFTDLDTILRESDVIVLSMAFNESLKNFIDKDSLLKMKPTSIIVNIARGELINEFDLADAIAEKRIAGLGADVISDWSLNNPLLKFDNVVVTPHMAFLADESLKNMADMIVNNIESYLNNEPKNIVNL
jgi:lactate dehydrogenase-like 2-hydroxyacid dehydrogenase